jgi:uncharacterized membrane protein affecting hemolysin expression
MEPSRNLAHIDAEQLRNLTATLITQLAERDAKITEREQEPKAKQLKVGQLIHEMATLNRCRYDRHSEQLDAVPLSHTIRINISRTC